MLDSMTDETIHGSSTTVFNVLHRVAVIMLASMLMILVLFGGGIYHLYNDYIIKRAETDAVSISQSFLASHKSLLFSSTSGNDQQLDLSNIEIEKIDEAFHQFLPPFNVIKIKIFSMDGTIIYSSDHSIIGKSSHGNIHLDKALSGFNSSELQTKNEMLDLSYESRFDVDVVETYVPIHNFNDVIVGSFEIYQDMTRFRPDVIKGVSLAVFSLLIVFVIVSAVAFKMAKIMTRELVLAQDELQALASIDSLTSLYNRYSIFNQLKKEAARVFREKGALSIALIDLDFFKEINDNYGHQVGDEVLKEVAKTIKNSIRKYDTVGRYGGEEFLVIFPNTNGDSAEEISERVRKSIESIVFEHEQKILSITISTGVSTLSYSETNIEQLIKRADEALYVAKENGRNRTMIDPSVRLTDLDTASN